MIAMSYYPIQASESACIWRRGIYIRNDQQARNSAGKTSKNERESAQTQREKRRRKTGFCGGETRSEVEVIKQLRTT